MKRVWSVGQEYAKINEDEGGLERDPQIKVDLARPHNRGWCRFEVLSRVGPLFWAPSPTEVSTWKKLQLKSQSVWGVRRERGSPGYANDRAKQGPWSHPGKISGKV